MMLRKSHNHSHLCPRALWLGADTTMRLRRSSRQEFCGVSLTVGLSPRGLSLCFASSQQCDDRDHDQHHAHADQRAAADPVDALHCHLASFRSTLSSVQVPAATIGGIATIHHHDIDFSLSPFSLLRFGVASWPNQAPPLSGCQGERFEQLFGAMPGPTGYRSSGASAWCCGRTKSPMLCSRKGSTVRSAARSSGSRASANHRSTRSWSSCRKFAGNASRERRAA